MHPIEHLRYVARAHGADPVDIALGAADALLGVARDPAATLVSARRLVEHHPLNPALWAMCAQAVTALEPRIEVARVADDVANDDVASHMMELLAEVGTVVTIGWSGHVVDALVRRGDVHVLVVDSLGDGQETFRHLSRRDVSCELVASEGLATAVTSADATIVPAVAVGDDAALCTGGALAMASVAYCTGSRLWTLVSAQTRLPRVLFDAMVAGVLDRPDPWASGVDLVPVSMWGTVVAGFGTADAAVSLSRIDACPPATEILRRSIV